PRRRDGQQVARRDVVGNRDIVNQNVAGLTVRTNDTGRDERAGDLTVDHPDVVLRLVEGRADIIAHPPVDRDVTTYGVIAGLDVLDGADPVDGHHGRAGDRAPRLDVDDWGRHARFFGCLGDLGPQVARHGGHVERLLVRGIGDAIAATQVEDVEILPRGVVGQQLLPQAQQALGGEHEPDGIENLGADVAVQAAQDQAIGGEALLRRLLGLAGGQGEAELLVLVGGRDEFVGIDVYARGHAHQDVLGGV